MVKAPDSCLLRRLIVMNPNGAWLMALISLFFRAEKFAIEVGEAYGSFTSLARSSARSDKNSELIKAGGCGYRSL